MKQLVLITLLFPLFGFSQDWENVKIKANQVAENIYYLEGRGGNIGVLVGTDGVLLIDDQFAVLTEKITQAVKGISSSKIKYIINTHYHGDHTGGNENFKNQSVDILAHKNVKERLSITFEDKIRNRTMKAKPESFWPTLSIPFDDTSIKLYGEEVNIVYLPSAHTDGDILVHFKKSNVMHVGDVVRGEYPFIDVAGGGSIDGIIKAQEKILELATDETKIIQGHGPLVSTVEVRELLKMLKETRKIIADAKNNGTALEDLLPQNPLSDYHERWNGNFINTDLFVQLVYESL